MRRLVALALTVAMPLLGSCANRLGRTMPECDSIITTSEVLQVQALPNGAFVPCVESLPLGWEYNHLSAQSGRSAFTLDSDRMGDDFATIITSATCDIGGTVEIESPHPEMRLVTDVVSDLVVPLVLIPEGLTVATAEAAQSIATGLVGTHVHHKRIELTIDRSDTPTLDRIGAALSQGSNILVVGLREAEQGTVTLILAGQSIERTLPLDEALDVISDSIPPPTVRGSWFHLFAGGCIEFRSDARGPETHTLERDIRSSLGFTDADEVRELGRSMGYDI